MQLMRRCERVCDGFHVDRARVVVCARSRLRVALCGGVVLRRMPGVRGGALVVDWAVSAVRSGRGDGPGIESRDGTVGARSRLPQRHWPAIRAVSQYRILWKRRIRRDGFPADSVRAWTRLLRGRACRRAVHGAIDAGIRESIAAWTRLLRGTDVWGRCPRGDRGRVRVAVHRRVDAPPTRERMCGTAFPGDAHAARGFTSRSSRSFRAASVVSRS